MSTLILKHVPIVNNEVIIGLLKPFRIHSGRTSKSGNCLTLDGVPENTLEIIENNKRVFDEVEVYSYCSNTKIQTFIDKAESILEKYDIFGKGNQEVYNIEQNICIEKDVFPSNHKSYRLVWFDGIQENRTFYISKMRDYDEFIVFTIENFKDIDEVMEMMDSAKWAYNS